MTFHCYLCTPVLGAWHKDSQAPYTRTLPNYCHCMNVIIDLAHRGVSVAQ